MSIECLWIDMINNNKNNFAPAVTLAFGISIIDPITYPFKMIFSLPSSIFCQ